MLGQEVRVLANQQRPAGYYTIDWDGRNSLGNKASSGVYFYRMEATPQHNDPTFVSLRKMLLLK
jgi:flagellar hook assembly protein FlgD